jgi:hypothetical protein
VPDTICEVAAFGTIANPASASRGIAARAWLPLSAMKTASTPPGLAVNAPKSGVASFAVPAMQPPPAAKH